jgi:hypothetical protein
MWCQAATQVHALDLPELRIREDGRKLQGVIEGRRDAGGLEIKKCKLHDALYDQERTASSRYTDLKS